MKSLYYVLWAFASGLLPALATDPPTVNQGANAVAAVVNEQSHGLIQLQQFTKTNGQKSVVNGVECYEMDGVGVILAREDCAMTGFAMGVWTGSFGAVKPQKKPTGMDAFNPFLASYAGNRQFAKGARLSFNMTLHFDLTERGWRLNGKLPADTPFVPAPLPDTSPAISQAGGNGTSQQTSTQASQ